MEDEIKSFIHVWITAIISLLYCYFITSKIPGGKFRFLSLLPVFYLFTVLPFNISSVHLGGPTIFYLTWLANFKLLLFCLDQGPLSLTSKPTPSLLQFISISCLPIKIRHYPSLRSPLNSSPNLDPSQILKSKYNPSLQYPKSPPDLEKTKSQSPLSLVCKALLLALVIRIYDYRAQLHPVVILVLYCCHIYLGLEIFLAMGAAPARALLRLELEPQFDEPYLSTSLQDFWGRRWNLMVTSILRPIVYNPIRSISTSIFGREWALLPALLGTFLVSGLMHEFIYFYFTRVNPSWEVTWFFVLHGICTAMEVAVKKALMGRYKLHRAVTGPLTIGFVALTGYWLFFPQLTRNHVDDRAISTMDIRECRISESVEVDEEVGGRDTNSGKKKLQFLQGM
ncbi:long-chain-alcohol O-fatty-acyltransferase-like isoform X2 [Macadamia integrifolia]|uniref:long-chain-alcohol O-fatty-acyltransferase-like isoform X2 n=1 Tax=Macadamia integrifolia TaxID=60698 RepID=UPI001C4E5002|nr:long-chain-alcohol O-fatty-acyltransferase-like isoform X2 [Macadamia integrifolia]